MIEWLVDFFKYSFSESINSMCAGNNIEVNENSLKDSSNSTADPATRSKNLEKEAKTGWETWMGQKNLKIHLPMKQISLANV